MWEGTEELLRHAMQRIRFVHVERVASVKYTVLYYQTLCQLNSSSYSEHKVYDGYLVTTNPRLLLLLTEDRDLPGLNPGRFVLCQVNASTVESIDDFRIRFMMQQLGLVTESSDAL